MIRKRGRYYYTKFKWKGETIDKSTRASDKKTARQIEAKIRSDLALGRFGILNPETRRVPTLREFLNESFLPHVAVHFQTKPKTAVYYQQAVSRLLGSPIARIPLADITSQHRSQFIEFMQTAKKKRDRGGEVFSPGTINQALRTLRRALRLAEEWKVIDRAPKIQLAAGERQRERVLSDEDYSAYMFACPQPWKHVAMIIYWQGMRPGEIYSLRWEQLRFTDPGLIQILRGKSRAARRTLEMMPAVQGILQVRYREQGCPESGWVFPSSSRSGHLEQSSAKNQHHKALKLSGVAPFEPYCLRHTALTRMGEHIPTPTLQAIAGHSSITMTQKYIHPQQDAIGRAFAQLRVKLASQETATVVSIESQKKVQNRQRGVTEGGDIPESAEGSPHQVKPVRQTK